MSTLRVFAALAFSCACLCAQQIKTTFVPLGTNANGVLMEPAAPNPKSRSALIYTHPNLNNFNRASGPEMAKRGYRMLLVNSYIAENAYEGFAPAVSAAIRYLRGLPGVEKVRFITHSGGGPVMTFYQNVAENGPKACNGPEKIYPCRGSLNGWPQADGLILLDSVPGGSFHQMTSIDPAAGELAAGAVRNAALDMFDAKNGYDPVKRQAQYSADFLSKFFAAQSARSEALIDLALEKRRRLEEGKGILQDDEPFVAIGIGVNASGARPYQTDTRLLSKTRNPHLLLKADGSRATQIIALSRPPLGMNPADLGTMRANTQDLTVRKFLAISSIRTTKDYKITEDSIEGVDWKSSATSVPSNIEGVTVPTLVVTMGCHYFVVPDEIIFEHAGAADKQYASVEGATHTFGPCKPEYGDTQKRLFDFVDEWVSAKKRF